MRNSNLAVTQGRLFGARGSVEKFRIDETSGLISRSVLPAAPDALPIVTEIGPYDTGLVPDDMRALADVAYLRRKESPSASESADSVRLVDMFSGCGAMTLGVVEACRAIGKRCEPVAGFDSNQRVADVFGLNFGLPGIRAVDLATVLRYDLDEPPSSAERELVEPLGEVNFVCAGPPCQGHSNLNNWTRRDDPKNALYYLVARFAQLRRPTWIIVENVIAVLHDKGHVVSRTQDALEKLGYETTEGIIDLWSLGVAQTRRRHVMVARLRNGGEPGKRELPFLEDLVAPYITKHRPVSWAIGDLINGGNSFMDAPRQPDPITQGRIDYLFDNNLYDLPKSHRPESHKGEHGDSYKAVYGRMRWDEPAPTMTGGFSTMGQGRFVHPRRRRTITAHEAARIQFIPDFFDFSPLERFRGLLSDTIGNAVPPKLTYVLALELMR